MVSLEVMAMFGYEMSCAAPLRDNLPAVTSMTLEYRMNYVESHVRPRTAIDLRKSWEMLLLRRRTSPESLHSRILNGGVHSVGEKFEETLIPHRQEKPGP